METGRTKEDLIWQGKDYKSRTVSLFVYERDHICEHEVMQNNFTAIYDTVEMPDSVYESEYDAEREVFFKKTNKATYGSKFYTKVVVAYPEKGGKGYVVSAWPQPDEKGGIGDQIYPE